MDELHYEVVEGGVNKHLMTGGGYIPVAPSSHERFSVICFNDNARVVGTLEWTVSEYGEHHAAGTFVDGGYQGRGIATEMWRLALMQSESMGAQVVHVSCVSDRGMTLARSLEKKFPRFEWKIYDIGERKLRILKGRKGKRGSESSRERHQYHPGGW